MSFQRTRPVPFFDTPLPTSYSFPSGHTLTSFCFYRILAAIVAVHIQSRTGRVVIWTLAALLVVLIGFSRVYLGVHYPNPSDVLASYAVATVLGGDGGGGRSPGRTRRNGSENQRSIEIVRKGR